MLRSLHIQNYVLIDSLDIDFPEGLVIITGQTGAGKSILLGALSLLMGVKADPSVITPGRERCVVEGCFLAPERLYDVFTENDLDWQDGSITVRRVVNSTGRSRSFVNDSPVAQNVLQEIASQLIDIHSQHQSLELADRRFQLSVLDSFCDNAELLSECKARRAACLALEGSIARQKESLRRLQADKEYNQSRYERLEQAKLRVGELEELEEEHTRLANAEGIKEDFASLGQIFYPQESDSLTPDAATKEAVRILSRLAAYLPSMQPLRDRLESVRIELDDIVSEVQDEDSSFSADTSRLQTVEDRMGQLYDLMAKFACSSEEELVEERDRLSAALFDTQTLEDGIMESEKQLDAARGLFGQTADVLRKRRQAALSSFSVSVQKSLSFLDMDHAVFSAVLSESAPSDTGTDCVQFLFSATGQNPVDVSKGASGGELSRIMLCLKQLLARHTQMPTMIFDEIDTGVSGSTADRMGTMICSMGEDMQVFAITHLPQVAAKGTAHFLVSKEQDSDGRTVSTIHALGQEARVQEIARMLSGSSLTPEALANARALLEQ